jgi:hypothetical protein
MEGGSGWSPEWGTTDYEVRVPPLHNRDGGMAAKDRPHDTHLVFL